MKTQNWLLKQAETNPNHLAVVADKGKLTFLQLKKKAEKLAGKLAALKAGKRVGLLANNTLFAYEAAMAILASGRTIVWLNRRLATEELRRQIADSGLQLCLVEDDLWRPEINRLFVRFSAFRQIMAPAKELTASFDYDQVASIMYTSGTTGKPKGVLQTFGNHFYSAVSSALNLGLRPDDEWLCVAPIFHISGFSILMRGLIYGMTVRLAKKFDAEKMTAILAEEAITIMSVVPFMLQKLLAYRQQSGQNYNAKFRCMLLGGGTSSFQVLKQCQKMNMPVVQCYGMTETCSQIIALRASDALRKIGSVGQPLFTTQLKLSDKGEILLKTPALTPGYLNLPHALAKKTVNGWYKTGDIGHLDEEGFLYIDGRVDEMMISGGENIFPQEVEQVYQNYPGLKEIAVVGQKDAKWGEVPAAFVVAEQKLAPAKLIAFGRRHLAHYKVPKYYYFVASLPKNASGKIRRFLLKEKINRR